MPTSEPPSGLPTAAIAAACPRRRLLAAAAALGLSFLLPPLAARAAARRGRERSRSLITLWLAGGPSQLETWDPHPGTAIGGPTRAIATAIPGVEIASDYPRVAERLARFSLIRSLVSREGDHERGTHAVRTGYRPDPVLPHPALGAVAAHELPTSGLDIPAYVALGSDGFPGRGGYLGGRFDPYRVFVPGLAGQNLVPHVRNARQERRLAALRGLDERFAAGRGVPVGATLHDHTLEAAVALMASEQLAAFSIAEEPAAVRAAYGETPFGRGCLVARRLVEAGVRSVDVTLRGFDTHAANFTGHVAQAAILDAALAALVDDLADRDLLESTVVLVAGEFGRTPRINPLDGRDHWPHGFSCLLAGGGVVPGQVVGSTDPEGVAREPERPVTVGDLSATVLAALGIDWQRELMTPIGRPLKLAEGTPVKGLVAG
jgi:hypothetical protein